ncbi:VanZ family protein [Butyrivibrio sp. AE3006]|uniref:VanZ family protein n=1 Tax=Butyrivibrio sp. AE3006 TaxID=1280673 RepID=UPI0004791C18|nr:VanZ family protein [Butyrivibrio sp. AE3006]
MKYFLLYIKQTLRFVLKPLSFVPAVVMMIVIFNFSDQTADNSSALSYKVGVEVLTVTNDVLDKGWSLTRIRQMSEEYQHYIRKAAHFTEYLILAITVAFPLYVYGLRGIPLVIVAGMICAGYACLDEYHQSFIDGRSPSKKDVVIDSCGALVGIIITRIVSWTGMMTIFHPLMYKEGERH